MLTGKTVLITGATGGIGKAIATTFADNDAHLILQARDEKKLEALKQELQSLYHCKISTIKFDVTKKDEIKQSFQNMYKEIHSIDVLVNNAGIMQAALFGMISRDMVENVYNVNVFSIYEISQYCSRKMGRDSSGSIINISSIMGTNGASGQSVYSGSKAALIGITKSMAKELAASNIRVNAISPGFIDTDMISQLTAKERKSYIDTIKMGRIGSAEDVANAALFLASDLASYITGQNIGVDGGMLI